MTRCTEFYEKLERDGNFCGMPRRSYEDAIRYWKEYRKEYEKSGGNSPLSEDTWLKQQRKTAETNKHKTERFVGTKSAKKQSEEPKEEIYSCSSCHGTPKESVEWALYLLKSENAPSELCDAVQKWIEETFK